VIPQPLSSSNAAMVHFTCQILAAVAGAALLFVGVSIDPGPLPGPTAAAASAENQLARCDRLAGAAVDKLAVNGIAVRSDDWRRERQSSVRACLNDFAKFDWSKDSMRQ
jgi:hypothetical protein